MNTRRILLNFGRHYAPGDVVTATALVRDIALRYPNKFQVSVECSFKELLQHNPYLTRFPREELKNIESIRLDYGKGIKRSTTEKIHYLTAWHTDFTAKSGVEVPLLFPKPDLHLSPEEKETRLADGRYWVILSGGKSDFTTKHYVYSRHQEVVNALRKCGIPVVQAGAAETARSGRPHHHHPILDGTLNLVGQTNLREFMRLIYQADGVICTITMAMHIAAAFDKPCVVTAGGREGWWWEGYVNSGNQFGPLASGKVKVEHRFLHAIGLLPCCADRGCWMSKVTRAEKDANKRYCHRPVQAESGQMVAECQAMIQTSHVIEAVMSYYEKGILPPIGVAPVIILPDGEKVAAPRQSPSAPPTPSLLAPLRGDLALPPALPSTSFLAAVPFDHPRIGGKMTLFVLLYGGFYELHRKCLGAIFSSKFADRLEVRVGSNDLGPESLVLVEGLQREGKISLHYRHQENARKYPVMREMFHDPQNPIITKWLIWFDDDTLCDRNKDWLRLAAQMVVDHPEHHMFGSPYHWHMKPGQDDWVRKASWYRGKSFRDIKGNATPNGNKIHFASGSCWILSVDAMQHCGIPDARLGHNGGDVMIGEQLWQGGYKLKSWDPKKQLVNWSSVPRRGLSEAHPGIR